MENLTSKYNKVQRLVKKAYAGLADDKIPTSEVIKISDELFKAYDEYKSKWQKLYELTKDTPTRAILNDWSRKSERVVKTTHIAQKPLLGCIIQGEIPRNISAPKSLVHIASKTEPDSILQSLQQFWNSESDPVLEKARTSLEDKCERYFQSTQYRTSTGRYGVRLPFNEKLKLLGPSKASALSQFYSLEGRLRTNPNLKDQYDQFMREYIELGHMTISAEDENCDEGYYTPHHPVFTSNKFRTVCNASNPIKTGVSLNEAQLVGEKLQGDLTITLLTFRQHRIGSTADGTTV